MIPFFFVTDEFISFTKETDKAPRRKRRGIWPYVTALQEY